MNMMSLEAVPSPTVVYGNHEAAIIMGECGHM